MLSIWASVSVLAVALTSAYAQSISDVPQCAEQAAFSSISSTGCQLSDIACICKDQSFINSLLPVVEKACSPSDLQKTIAFTESLCNTVGITVSVSASAAPATPTGSPTPVPASSIVASNPTLPSSNATSAIKPTAFTPTNASAGTNPPVFSGAAARYGEQNSWRDTLFGLTVLLLL